MSIISKKNLDKLNNIKKFSKYVLTGILALTLTINCNSQQKLRFGLKIHPNITFSSTAKESVFQKKYFKKKQALIGMNIGLASTYQNENKLFEISSNFITNKVGLKFQNFSSSDYSELTYTTLSFTNQISFGYRILKKTKPNLEIFILPSIQYNISSIYGLHGKGNFNNSQSNVTLYEEQIPDINLNFKTIGIGFDFKIRANIRKIRKIDYGLSYKYLLEEFPSVGINAVINNKSYNCIFIPRIHLLNIDFIYYFKGKNANR